jgi:hypothetical protein
LHWLPGLTLACGVSFAGNGTKGNGAPSGPHWQFNIIGKKKNGIGGDTSNGRSIFIPLKTVGTPNYLECGDAQNNNGVKLVDDVWPNYSSDVPANNARIAFEVCETCSDFQISDRDAVDDGVATIQVPASMLDASTKGILFDVYIRVMGKPLQCMEINGYAFDGNYYFNSGTVYLSKKGKTTFVKVNDLFDVYYCDIVTDPTCSPTEISVFDDVFQSYFWELYNDGTKIVQVRIYPQIL